MKKLLLLCLILFCFSCTDARMSSLTSLGSKAKVECYSGGKLVYSGMSTGKVATTEQSDGWEFREEGSGDFIRVSGDCIIRN